MGDTQGSPKGSRPVKNFYQGTKRTPSTHYRVWIVRASGPKEDRGIHPKDDAYALAGRLAGENPLDMVECAPAGGAPVSDDELTKVFDRVKRGR